MKNIVVIGLALLCSTAFAAERRKFPEEYYYSIKNADKVVLVALDESLSETPDAKTFHGYPIARYVTISIGNIGENLATKINRGIADGKPATGSSFAPSQGLHVSAAKGSLDLVFSFSTGQVECYYAGEKKVYSTNREAESLIKSLLGAAEKADSAAKKKR